MKTYLLARRHLVNEKNCEESDEISSRRLTSMALDVARALSYLAELKYVHRFDSATYFPLSHYISKHMYKLLHSGMLHVATVL